MAKLKGTFLKKANQNQPSKFVVIVCCFVLSNFFSPIFFICSLYLSYIFLAPKTNPSKNDDTALTKKKIMKKKNEPGKNQIFIL